ncbi:MAG: hypothetical protein JWM64_1892 [Frankiales bacterium]|nr:hypothetical protein [Frankiales bacterium]
MSTSRRGGLDGLDPALRETWAAGRLWAAHTAPYLATAVLALQPVLVVDLEEAGVEADALRAFPVDAGWRVHLDPVRLAGTPVPVLGFWLLHQVSHLLREHADRGRPLVGEPGRDGRTPDQRRWGAAADLEVDDDLPPSAVPADALLPSRAGLPSGRAAEQYHLDLVRAPRLLAAVPDCGSAVDGVRRGWEGGDDGGLTEEDARLLRQETAARIAAQARERADVPGGWRRWAQEVLEPTLDWRHELRSAVRRGVADVVGRTDFTYQRRSRRQLPRVVLPGMHRPLPRVCVVLDTSASMSARHLGTAVAEVGGVLSALGVGRAGLRVLCCDTTAHGAAQVLDARDVTLVGGGGTDLSAGLEAAAALRPRADLLVVLTDGGTDWPPDPPRARTVVALLGGDGSGGGPPWGKTVHVPLDERD